MGSGDCSGYGTQKSDSDQATDGLLITKERTTYYLTTLNNSFSVSTINTSSIFIIQGAAFSRETIFSKTRKNQEIWNSRNQEKHVVIFVSS
jgi:Xaa-Pro aminopeptidase